MADRASVVDASIAAPLRSGEDTVALKYRDPVPVELVQRIAVRILELRSED